MRFTVLNAAGVIAPGQEKSYGRMQGLGGDRDLTSRYTAYPIAQEQGGKIQGAEFGMFPAVKNIPGGPEIVLRTPIAGGNSPD